MTVTALALALLAATAPAPPPYTGAYQPRGVDEIGAWAEADEDERQLALSPLRIRDAALVAAAVLGAGLVAWAVTVDRMAGMDAGPGTDLGALGWFLGLWATMMAAMMLPATAPVVTLHARTAGAAARSTVR